LLEDVNLKGARGILVNVTAGFDLSLGEFSEVGDIISSYAAEDATVVVGTVIDPEMTDELRVTVVATGLGALATSAQATVEPKARKVVDNTPTPKQPDGTTDYRNLERPTVSRQGAAKAARPQPQTSKDMDYLDIPAFLRRQAD
jgi:cell division protein FtsZ